MIFIAILAHHTTLPIYAFESELFFDNILFLSFKKKPPSQTYTQIYKETNKKNFLGHSITNSAIHCVSYIQKTTSNLSCSVCIFINTYIVNIKYMSIHNNTQI